MMRKKKKEVSPMKEAATADGIITDPFGMYTGIPDDPNERPIQDADDL